MTERRAVILFTRIPVPGHTKTRLMPYCSPRQCAQLHASFLRDINRHLQGIDADVFIYYAGPGNPEDLKTLWNPLRDPDGGWQMGSGRMEFREQVGEDLGERMYTAMEQVLAEGYDKCVLTGTDLPDLTKSIFQDAFTRLDGHDVVLGPTRDGGYYLIGSREPQHVCFENQKYGGNNVFEDTAAAVLNHGLTLSLTRVLHDVDTREDLLERVDRMRKRGGRLDLETDRLILKALKISVIVPIYNEIKILERTMQDIKRAFPNDEVIFVDGGSTDGTAEELDAIMAVSAEDAAETAEAAETTDAKNAENAAETDHAKTDSDRAFKVLHCEKGRARQMNLGAREATGDILFFLHCDSRLPKDPAKEIRRVYASHLAGCFRIAFPTKRFLMLTNSVLSNMRAEQEGIMFGDQGIFIDRRLFEKMGGFPEIPLMEDYEFSRMLKRRGISIGVARARIISSDRRYPKSTKGTLRLMKRMYDMRQCYLHGADPARLARLYRDVR